jgi:hypothetical protein
MATIHKLTKLFSAVSSNDVPAATAIASEIVSDEERRGNRTAARQLRSALHPNFRQSTPMESDESALLATALTELPADVRLADVELAPAPRNSLLEVTREWTARAQLEAEAIPRRTKVLLHGPPGCGKSLTARALGAELGLPVFVARYDSVIGAMLGQTSLRLRLLFRFVESRPCILLLDEIDAIGKTRGNPLDVGELDRIAITMMQELEHTRPAGLLVATSNVAEHLDQALWRRFVLAAFTRRKLREMGLPENSRVRRLMARCQNYANVVRLVDDERRRRVIRKQPE